MTDDRDATLEIHKQRNGEVQHKTVSLWFNKAAQQYATNSRRRSIRYVDFSTQPAEVEL
jgi:twinkle protein